MAKLTESVVETATIEWLGDLGYEVFSRLAIAPGEPAAERTAGFSNVAQPSRRRVRAASRRAKEHPAGTPALRERMATVGPA